MVATPTAMTGTVVTAMTGIVVTAMSRGVFAPPICSAIVTTTATAIINNLRSSTAALKQIAQDFTGTRVNDDFAAALT